MSFVALPGFRDAFPDALARRRRIFEVWREVAARYGFEEYDGPPLEPLELYTQKSGEEIVEQLYTFTDKGGRSVALRPEMTPTLARMVAARAAQLRKPIRWFAIPQLFRYERQQRGRLREHFQLNMDIIGEAGPLADAEVIAAAVDVIRGLGFGPADVRVRVSDRKAVTLAAKLAVGLDNEGQVAGMLSALDKFEGDERRAAGVLEETFAGDAHKVGRAVEFARGLAAAPTAIWNLVPRAFDVTDDGELLVSAKNRLDECLKYLEAMGLRDFVEVDFRVVRGLAYYTGIVFELFDAKRELRAICGGGRYDNLLKDVGGVDLPCVGFGMGDVVLGELIATRDGPAAGSPAVDVFVAVVGEEDRPSALALAHALRERGIRVEFALRTQALGKQLELAAARGARHAVVIGPSEREAGEAVVRALGTGAESRVRLEHLATGYGFA